jgi:hypothetical protein
MLSVICVSPSIPKLHGGSASPHYTYTSLNNYSSITARIFHRNPYFSVRYPLLIWFQRHESSGLFNHPHFSCRSNMCATPSESHTFLFQKSIGLLLLLYKIFSGTSVFRIMRGTLLFLFFPPTHSFIV